MQTVNFQAPQDYSAEQEAIARQRKYAEMMAEQANQPLHGQMAGQFYVAPSWTQGAAKLAQALSGRIQNNRVDEKQKALAERLRMEDEGTTRDFLRAARGTQPQAPMTPNDDDGNANPMIPGMAPNTDEAIMLASKSRNPMVQKMAAMLLTPPESAFAKVDPSKFTPESIRAFAASGGKNYDLLKAREKVVADNLGGTLQYRGEYSTAPLAQALKSNSPDALLNNQWQQFQHANPSAAQNFDMALRGQQHTWETGQHPPVAPRGATPPFNPQRQSMQVPPQVQAARDSDRIQILRDELARNPNDAALRQELANAESGRNYAGLGAGKAPVAIPGLTPKAAAGLAAKQAEQKMELEGKREFNMAGLGPSIDEARSILRGDTGALPTASGIGSYFDKGAQFFGATPKGAPQADKLKAIAGNLTLKMPRMEGPQSDRDAMLYREMSGQIGDDTLPIERRMAALDTVEQLYRKYDKTSLIPANRGASGSFGEPPAGAVRRKGG